MRLRSTRSPLSLPAGWLLPLLAVTGCTGGQSGTESEGGRFDDPFMSARAGSCGCELAGSGSAVRAEIESTDSCGVQATVREVLGRGPLAEGPQLAAGDTIGGAPLLPCAEGLTLAPGDDVLIVHVPGPAGDAQRHGQLLVAPWAETLRISSFEGEAVSLPRSELSVLLDPDACEPRLYPDAGPSDSAVGGDPSLAADALPLDGDADGGVEGAPACEPL